MGKPFPVCLGQAALDVQDLRAGESEGLMVGHLEKSAEGLKAIAGGQAEEMEDQTVLLNMAGAEVFQLWECAQEESKEGLPTGPAVGLAAGALPSPI